MPIDPECQAIADRIVALRGRLEAERSTLAGTGPAQRWEVGFSAVATLQRDLDAALGDFDRCLESHQLATDIEVEVFDTSHGPAAASQVTAWSRNGPTAQPVPSEPIVIGRATIALPATELALTVEPAGSAAAGAEFRSGWLERVPRRDLADAVTRVEIVVADAMEFGQADLDRALAALGLPYETAGPIGGTGGTLTVRVDTIRVDVVAPRIVIHSTGEAHASGVGMTATAPYTVTVPVTAALVRTPDPVRQVDVRLDGDATLTLGGPTASLLQPVLPFIRSLVAKQAASAIADALARDLPRAVAASFGLSSLPDGSTVSFRSLAISPAGVAFQATVGAFGYALSRFVP